MEVDPGRSGPGPVRFKNKKSQPFPTSKSLAVDDGCVNNALSGRLKKYAILYTFPLLPDPLAVGDNLSGPAGLAIAK